MIPRSVSVSAGLDHNSVTKHWLHRAAGVGDPLSWICCALPAKAWGGLCYSGNSGSALIQSQGSPCLLVS